ncbi:PRC-barrel domain containing protein [Streptomyces sp. NPDC046712]|uniref:PRC-barrel domain containing protein n=1 Tax=Streptomyces sp. NPDC046712 TaxID=3154802 RepID=UPI0034108891
MGADIWGYPETSGHVPGARLIGYGVEATDGSIGKIDKHTEDVGRSYLVVDTGPWILGKRVLLPAGLVSRIDPENETVHVSCTKDEVKDSPNFDSGQYEEDGELIKLIEYYYSNRHM